jgi:hypothetical protein
MAGITPQKNTGLSSLGHGEIGLINKMLEINLISKYGEKYGRRRI